MSAKRPLSRHSAPEASGEDRVEAANEALDFLRRVVTMQEEEIDELNRQTVDEAAWAARVDAAEAERDKERRKVARLMKERDTLKVDNQEVRDDLESARSTTSRLETENAELRKELADSQHTIATLTEHLQQARADLRAQEKSSGRKATAEIQMRPRLVAGRPDRAEDKASVPTQLAGGAASIASVYIGWCRMGGGFVGRVAQFRDHLTSLVPGADVQKLSRDADSPVRPIQFKTGGVSPVEYWIISHEGTHSLVPHPAGPTQFRELSPCFEGHATPATLRAIEPAELTPTGAGFEMVATGTVSP